MAVSGVNGGAIPLSPNAIINGAFDIWQRGTSFTNPSNLSYTADRFAIQRNGSGATRTISRQSFTPGELNVPGYGQPEFYFRLSESVAGSGESFKDIIQRIEDVRTFAGQTVTISFWARADVARDHTVAIGQRFGSGGSSASSFLTGTVSVGTSWARHSVTLSLDSVSEKTIGPGSLVEVQIRNPLNSTFTLDIWGVQVEAGSVATPFRRNSPNIQAELAACQRYYQRLSGWTGFGEGTTAIAAFANYLVELRAPASIISTVSGSTLSWRTNAATDASSTTFTLTAPTSGTQGLWFLFTNLTGIVDNQAYHSRLLNIPNEKVIEVVAEL